MYPYDVCQPDLYIRTFSFPLRIVSPCISRVCKCGIYKCVAHAVVYYVVLIIGWDANWTPLVGSVFNLWTGGPLEDLITALSSITKHLLLTMFSGVQVAHFFFFESSAFNFTARVLKVGTLHRISSVG
jgi:hypothetical protein